MNDNDKKIIIQEVKADSLPVVIIYIGTETKEYILRDNKDHNGLQLVRKDF